MRVLLKLVALAWTMSFAAGCAIFMDNGTHLGFALERESRALLASGDRELVFDYSPLTGINQRYEVKLSASRSPVPPYGGYIVVTGENGGGTSYQGRYVYIAHRFDVSKFNEPAHITLRNQGGRIEVVDVR